MSSFLAALSGMRANQSWIDVIGNNLANSNTPGFKTSRTLFADLLSVTHRPATPPNGSVGGTNPVQLGLGVQVSQIDRNFLQGSLNVTGRSFDLAMQGRGFFAVTDSIQTLYTRVGSFGIDAVGNVVDQGTGFRVLDSSGSPTVIDTTAVLPPSATTSASFTGNLPAEVTGPLAEQVTSSSAFAEGAAATMSGANPGPFFVPVGETWTMELIVNGGAPETVSIAGTGALTAADVALAINNQTDHVVASVGSGQEIVLTSDLAGNDSTIEVNAGDLTRDLKSMLGLLDFVQGTETAATGASDLSDLTSNLADYTLGDVIEVAGTDVDGSSAMGSFTYGVDGTTIDDLVTFLDALYTQSTVAFNATSGQIEVTADTSGEAELSLALTDAPGQTGSTNWSANFFAVTTNGTGPDVVDSSIEVFDAAGTSHIVAAEFTRQDDGTWNLVASVPASVGSVNSGPITGITFNDNGSILTPTTGTIDVQFGSQGPQTVTLDLGTSGAFDGLTQFGNPASVVVDFQDGYGAGDLANVEIELDGSIQGYYTNGQTSLLGTIGVAMFSNENALGDVGNNYWRETSNTGTRTLSGGQVGGAGEVIGGALEGSNVDTAEQFVHLIEAQRGFQANARVVTVQDEILAEVANLI